MANPTIADVQEAVATRSGGKITASYHQIRRAVRAGRIPAIHADVNRIRFRPDQVENAATVMIALATGGAA